MASEAARKAAEQSFLSMPGFIADLFPGTGEQWVQFHRTYVAREARIIDEAITEYSAKLERKAALVEELVTALSRLYTFPGVRDLLAPKESLGSIVAEVEVAIAKAEALIGPAKG